MRQVIALKPPVQFCNRNRHHERIGLIVQTSFSFMSKKLATVAQIEEFDAIIDVRSPSEFAEDHLPGAQNCPVLSDEERVKVGTLYKQVSAFEAKKIGAVLVGRKGGMR